MKSPLLSLVGAGPGDPELITLKAIKAISQANVILYDALANEELLSHASANAVTRFVGKRYGCHALSQSEINQLIIEYAFSHGRVVRLKGGDPFVFGRAQEEIEVARNHGIEVEIIPGISSALAVPATQMIPLTCRLRWLLRSVQNRPQASRFLAWRGRCWSISSYSRDRS